MRNIVLGIILLVFVNADFLYAQNIDSDIGYRKAKEFIYDPQKLEDIGSITWYGWDYSHLIVNDHNVVASDIKPKWIPYWYLKVDASRFGTNKIRKKFKNKEFNIDTRTIQGLVSKVNESKLVDIYRSPIKLDSLKEVVKNYDLGNSSGMGIVSIVSEMRKADISVIIYTVFFDIQTKELIYVVKSRGKAGDKGGFGRFYKKGLVLGMKAFVKKYNKLHKSSPPEVL